MTNAPKFGISFAFQAHRELGEPYDKAYREGLELAAEASRLGFHSIWASEHHGEADGYCPSPVVACAALAVAAPNCRIGQAIALAPLHGHPLRLAEDLAVARQPLGRTHRDRAGAGLSPGRVRHVRLALRPAYVGLRGMPRYPRKGLDRRAVRLRRPHLQGERRPAAAAARQARSPAAVDRRRGAQGAGARREASRRLPGGAADRVRAPACASSSRSTPRSSGRVRDLCRAR